MADTESSAKMSSVDENEYDKSYSPGFDFANTVGWFGYTATVVFFLAALYTLGDIITSDMPELSMIVGANVITAFSVLGLLTLFGTKQAREYLN